MLGWSIFLRMVTSLSRLCFSLLLKRSVAITCQGSKVALRVPIPFVGQVQAKLTIQSLSTLSREDICVLDVERRRFEQE